ncbi:response regulator [Streptomyces sp. SL13]|uniref:Transcriptional regulatory protein n=1 Tax=Streptantibioticus silvisoli TaxID=2705255 RepID=A0AA90KIG4_9ACTN|nr:response regulator [Streptantibioticus silvisoli]MDI5965578.1 response regulator [Streptantibioticus silvisoli]MDI5972599.1 response regulator [Streptantibioticus silvisoli]
MIRTLVVEDDFRVGQIHAVCIERLDGFEVVGQSPTVADALTAVGETRADLLLLDIYLPDGTGLDVLRRLTRDRAEARPDAIMTTAARDVASIRAAMKLGAVGYLVKPFTLAALGERLTAYRELRQRMTAMDGSGQPDQSDVDALFSAARPAALPPVLAKGHSAPTLALVRDTVRSARRDLSAAEVAESTGVSRATAQRYLSYLVREGLASLELRYGSTGRPEHRYRAVT